MRDRQTTAHLLAVLTVFIWSTTIISIKWLLEVFSPTEILFYRFVVGYLALTAFDPHFGRPVSLREELLYAAAGLTGVTLYMLLQNIALQYTLGSNMGVIVSVAPMFTALLMRLIDRDSRLGKGFVAGFLAAMTGIVLVTINGQQGLQVAPLGDILTVLAALSWAIYSLLLSRIGRYGHTTVRTMRKVFGYGLLTMLPALAIFDFRLGLERFLQPSSILNMAYLGLGASALCYLTWNYAVRVLGPVKTSAYIYLMPVATIVVCAVVLHEPVTPMGTAGAALTIAGLYLSERQQRRRGTAAEPVKAQETSGQAG